MVLSEKQLKEIINKCIEIGLLMEQKDYEEQRYQYQFETENFVNEIYRLIKRDYGGNKNDAVCNV